MFALKNNFEYKVPDIAKNKQLKQGVSNLNIHKKITKSNTFKERIINGIFEDREVRSALEMLSKV